MLEIKIYEVFRLHTALFGHPIEYRFFNNKRFTNTQSKYVVQVIYFYIIYFEIYILELIFGHFLYILC